MGNALKEVIDLRVQGVRYPSPSGQGDRLVVPAGSIGLMTVAVRLDEEQVAVEILHALRHQL